MVTEIVTARIAPLAPPYEQSVDAQLATMMPAGVPPIALFRTLVKNLPMTRAMSTWGAYELSPALSLSLRHREIVIDRTCGLCGCEYEWSTHVMYFAQRAELTDAQVASLAGGAPEDACWNDPRDQLVIRTVDALHRDADIPDDLWQELAASFDEASVLDLLLLCGWYHAISFVARSLRVPLEPGAPTFDSVSKGPGRHA